MGITSRRSKEEIRSMSKQEFMREAVFSDIVKDCGKVFQVAYLARESTKHKDQVKALGIQIQMLEEFCNKPHFRLLEHHKFIEEGKSGLCMDSREVLKKITEAAKNREFDILVIDSLSRLGREAKNVLIVIDTLKEYGVGVLILKGSYWTYNLDYTDTTRLLLETGLAQSESIQTSTRVKSHMDTIAKNGQLLGGDMFGYRLSKAVERRDNTLVQEKVEAYTVRTIFEKYTSDDPDEVLSTSGLVSYLVENHMRTYEGDYRWTPSKVRRILMNAKYMGYQMYGKYKVVDTVKKKKIQTHVEPVRENVLDEEGNVIKRCNLIRGNWEPIVSEEMWWKAYERRTERSALMGEVVKRKGLRVSSDAYARKAFCSCGYSLSPQYTHVAADGKTAQMRYKCRWQINVEALKRSNALEENEIICRKPAVSEAKLWLSGKQVFEYIFDSGKDAVLKTLLLIEKCKQEKVTDNKEKSIQELQEEMEKVKKRRVSYINMKADGEITAEEYQELAGETKAQIEELEIKIGKLRLESAKADKKLFDMAKIQEKLDTFVNMKGEKVCDEMIDLFVERIIYRGNDEFLWVINLSGDATGSEAKYRISGYDKEYAKSLQSDKNFDIVAQFVIPMEECRAYCEGVLKRRFMQKYWQPITVKIAVC